MGLQAPARVRWDLIDKVLRSECRFVSVTTVCRLPQRCVHKGQSIADDAADDIAYLAHRVHNQSRRILNDVPPEQWFETQLAAIYAA